MKTNREREMIFLVYSFLLAASLLLTQQFNRWIQLICLIVVGGGTPLFIILIEDYFHTQKRNYNRYRKIKKFIDERKVGDQLTIKQIPHYEWWTISTEMVIYSFKMEKFVLCNIYKYKYAQHKAKIVISNDIIIKIAK